ncbi:MAG TPA: type II secretion system protein [Candidatus Paceibacterota bacterium]
MKKPFDIAQSKGFTLIEVMVSVAIFSVVMTVSLGALLSMSDSDRRAEALKSVVNNLNFALDSMTRTIRTGYNYHCNTTGTDFSTPGPQDCTGAGASYLALKAADGTLVAYCLYNGQLMREQLASGPLDTICGSSNFSSMTSSELTITNLQFIVIGSCPQQNGAGCTSDNIQPKVTILISGSLKTGTNAPPIQLSLQSSATQRIYDQ